MASRAAAFVTESWYTGAFWLYLLLPFTLLYHVITLIRKFCYRAGIFSSYRSCLPVIVVGNITVGGTGKSPLVACLVGSLREQGYTPGIVSRGYGSNIGPGDVREVHVSSLVSDVGDEPLMLKRALACSVMVSPSRALAVQALERTGCDIVIADDGLQHYALARDIEICVIDGVRQWGNGWMLPMGPLRESLAKINTLDFIVVNGVGRDGVDWRDRSPNDVIRMDLDPGALRSISLDGKDEMALENLKASKVNAVAAIGHPERFFSTLQQHGLQLERHVFEDHHLFSPEDFRFSNDLPIIMTEKDAVKCRELDLENAWYLPVSARLSGDLGAQIIKSLKTKGWFDG